MKVATPSTSSLNVPSEVRTVSKWGKHFTSATSRMPMKSPSSVTAPKQSKMLTTISTVLLKWWGYGSTHKRPRLCQCSHAPGHNTPSTLVACPWRRLSPLNTWALPSRQLVRLRTKLAGDWPCAQCLCPPEICTATQTRDIAQDQWPH